MLLDCNLNISYGFRNIRFTMPTAFGTVGRNVEEIAKWTSTQRAQYVLVLCILAINSEFYVVMLLLKSPFVCALVFIYSTVYRSLQRYLIVILLMHMPTLFCFVMF